MKLTRNKHRRRVERQKINWNWTHTFQFLANRDNFLQNIQQTSLKGGELPEAKSTMYTLLRHAYTVGKVYVPLMH